jgi:hypothetical protein
MKVAYRVLVRYLEGRDGTIILKRVSKIWVGVNWIHVAEDRNQWQAGCCEHGNESLGSKGD